MKGILYYFIINCIQCFYDICLVRAFEATGNKSNLSNCCSSVDRCDFVFSWVIALAEYSCQVPANRLGFSRERRAVLVDAA